MVFIVSLFFSGFLFAASEADFPVSTEVAAAVAKPESAGATWFKLLGAVSIIGLAGTGAALWIRRQQKPRDEKSGRLKIRLVSQFYLAPKKSLAVVQVAGESMLIGVCDHGIGLIKTLALLDEDESSDVPPKDFKKALDQSVFDEKELSEIQEAVSTKLQGFKELK